MKLSENAVKNAKSLLFEISTVAVGSLIYGAGLTLFLLPAKIVMGGVSGVASILYIAFGLPVGLLTVLMNIPLAALGIWRFGWRFMLRTLIGTVATSLAADLLALLKIAAPTSDPLLAAIVGGAMVGTGCGMLFSRGYTTGGSDLVGWLIRERLPNVPVQKIIGVLDFAVVLAAALISQSAEALIYSAVTVFAGVKATGYILSGSDAARFTFIFSDKYAQIADRLHDELGRGVSVIDCTGWHTGEKRRAVMCAITPKELYKLKRVVVECDPTAFAVTCDASEVNGEGFKNYIGFDS